MVDSLKIEVALDGSEKVKRDFYDIGVAARNAFLGITAAVAAAGAALARYTSQAAEVADALGRLSDLSGQAMKSVSALQIAFAQGGVSVQKFAAEFTALEQKVQEAAQTMAKAVEQSAQRIAKAQQSVVQSALSVRQAELGLQEARLAARKQLFGETDPDASKRIADARSRLAVEEAQQRLAAARQAQQQAAHALRVAEANDLTRNIELYKQMGAGVKVAFDPLTTQATKNAALFATLAQAGENYRFVLADIVKNASELERIQIGKALGLDQSQLDRLKQGGDALRAQQQAVENLGIALDDADRTKLKAFSDSWSKLGATASAALEKLGAALAPIGTLIAGILQPALEAVINQMNRFGDAGRGVIVVFNALGTAAVAAWNAVDTATGGALTTLTNFISTLAGIAWPSFGAAGQAAWDIITGAIMRTLNPLQTVLDLLARIGAARAGTMGPLQPGSPGFDQRAGGGFIGGTGTGTSDSNLAWVSRGEHIMPAGAVRQPGVLALLEALRRSGGNLSAVLNGMGRFALGGMVPRAIPAFASGGLAGGNLGTLTLGLPSGQFVSVRTSSSVADTLRREAAMAQVRSGGRKPSRYS